MIGGPDGGKFTPPSALHIGGVPTPQEPGVVARGVPQQEQGIQGLRARGEAIQPGQGVTSKAEPGAIGDGPTGPTPPTVPGQVPEIGAPRDIISGVPGHGDEPQVLQAASRDDDGQQDRPAPGGSPGFWITPLAPDQTPAPVTPAAPKAAHRPVSRLHITPLDSQDETKEATTGYPEAHIAFKDHVEGDPRTQPWYAFLQQAEYLHTQGRTDELDQLGDRISFAYSRVIAAGTNGALKPAQVQAILPEVTWVQDPGIHRVTGHDFALPVMTFGADNIELYAALHGGKVNQGVSTQIPAELLGLPQGTRPVSLLTVPAAELDQVHNFHMPHEQRRRHELMHSVDPHINNRPGLESLIQTEMLATLGETTGTTMDNLSYVTTPSWFWFNYLRDRQATLPYANPDTAQRISDHVHGLTSTWPKTPNDEIVRNLMLTRSNQQLRDVIAPPRRRGALHIEEIF